MRCIFFGTPEFALPTLRALQASPHDVCLLVTQPDRPRGRGRQVQPPPVKRCAQELGLPVLQPRRASEPSLLERLGACGADAIVVVAYGQLLPEALLGLCPHGCINLHPSLLPRYRGAAPISTAILRGDAVTGVTTMVLDAGLDSGDLLLQEEVAIAPDDTAASLHDRLAEVGARLMVTTLTDLERGALQPRRQDDAKAILTRKLRKEDGRLDWCRPAVELERQIRAYHPWPGAFTEHGGERLRVLRARVDAAARPGGARDVAGRVAAIDEEGIALQTGRSLLVLLEVQPANKSAMSAAAYLRGRSLRVGEVFGGPRGEGAEAPRESAASVTAAPPAQGAAAAATSPPPTPGAGERDGRRIGRREAP
ncbi:MAG: methionyl-tRNA formyltransferase [Candidatus Tectomicrobia bacterium]|nr:methionyl-tRNA formyltransferase [Candidatus Tectomicrobia bacterium]